jgi:hypothetical protein
MLCENGHYRSCERELLPAGAWLANAKDQPYGGQRGELAIPRVRGNKILMVKGNATTSPPGWLATHR